MVLGKGHPKAGFVPKMHLDGLCVLFNPEIPGQKWQNFILFKNNGASLVAQWLRICLPMQGTRVSSPGLGRSHMPRSSWAREPQLLSLRVWSLCSATREAAIVRGPRSAMKSGPRLPQLDKALAQKRTPNTAKNKIK